MPRINTQDETDRWQYKCPKCRSEYWRCNDGTFRCRACGATVTELFDAARGEFIPRERFEFVGPDADHKGAFGTPTVEGE
jgi:hypothetical protein